MRKKYCECEKDKIKLKAKYFCEICNRMINVNILSFRFEDDCSFKNGITDVSGEFKIFRCKHYVYCPLCGWRCDSVESLEKHLDMTDDYGKHLCEGLWRYGYYGVEQVKTEIKYWKLYKKQEAEQITPPSAGANALS